MAYIAQDSREDHSQEWNKNPVTHGRERRSPHVLKNGAVYEGDWLNSKRDGYGTQAWTDGAKYDGEWKDNKANGFGKFVHVNGDIYKGKGFMWTVFINSPKRRLD